MSLILILGEDSILILIKYQFILIFEVDISGEYSENFNLRLTMKGYNFVKFLESARKLC